MKTVWIASLSNMPLFVFNQKPTKADLREQFNLFMRFAEPVTHKLDWSVKEVPVIELPPRRALRRVKPGK
jgi:hypothetical protein